MINNESENKLQIRLNSISSTLNEHPKLKENISVINMVMAVDWELGRLEDILERLTNDNHS